MRYPFWHCRWCDEDVAEAAFPLRPSTPVPSCPKCGRVDDMDIVLGDENTVIDTDTVIWEE